MHERLVRASMTEPWLCGKNEVAMVSPRSKALLLIDSAAHAGVEPRTTLTSEDQLVTKLLTILQDCRGVSAQRRVGARSRLSRAWRRVALQYACVLFSPK